MNGSGVALPSSPKFIDLTGQRFGRWTVIALDSMRINKALWACRCDCGVQKVVWSCNLRSGKSTSCGCLKKEEAARMSHSRVTKHPCYRTWNMMKQRCLNPKDDAYPDYGGRGISVCDRWLGQNGFANFLEDMGPRPSPAHELDRWPNNNGNYEPGNTRWATRKQQNQNKRNNTLITFAGRTQCIAQWAEQTGLSAKVISARLLRGWTWEEALAIPLNQRRSLCGRQVTTLSD